MTQLVDFTTIDYLKTGNDKQKQLHEVLQRSRIFDILAEFSPILAGTFPIEIDIPGSDFDILCCFANPDYFSSVLKENFQTQDGFTRQEMEMEGERIVLANFNLDGFPVEIFGQNIPVLQQRAFRHMIVENRILQEKGEAFRKEIIRLKIAGVKTEPAFAQLIGIEGDPYLGLLEYGEK
jgi:hypothetical protein